MLLYVMTVVTGFAGFSQLPWWSAVAGACMISLLLFREDTRAFAPPGDEASWAVAETISNMLIGACAGALAFAIGRLVALLLV